MDATQLAPLPRQPQFCLQDFIGQTVGGGFIIKSVLGSGGMGHVFAAENPRLGYKRAAVKVLTPGADVSPSSLERFAIEARLCAQLSHPNIVPITDAGVLPGGHPYILMNYIRGGSLLHYFASQRTMSFATLLAIMAQVAAALDAAHQLRPAVVHRDVKPENILIEHGTPWPRAYLSDFGVAKLRSECDAVQLTAAATVLGSPGYLAPEILVGTGARDADARADVYSLATTIYHLLCGRLPYEADTTYVLLEKMMRNEPFPPPRMLAPNLPAGWNQALMAALAHDRERRTPSVRTLIAQLASGLPGGNSIVAAVAPSLASSLPTRPQRKRWQLAAVAAIGVICGAVAGYWSMRAAQAQSSACLPLQPDAAMGEHSQRLGLDRSR